MQNYLRMLWGKKVLEWSRTPEEAWDVLFELNDRFALDGRDPSSVGGEALMPKPSLLGFAHWNRTGRLGFLSRPGQI